MYFKLFLFKFKIGHDIYETELVKATKYGQTQNKYFF